MSKLASMMPVFCGAASNESIFRGTTPVFTGATLGNGPSTQGTGYLASDLSLKL